MAMEKTLTDSNPGVKKTYLRIWLFLKAVTFQEADQKNILSFKV